MSVSEAASWTVLVVAGLSAIGVVFKWVRGGFRKVEDVARLIAMTEQLKDVIDRELNHNHGSSLKDDVHGIAVSVHRAHNRIDAVEEALSNFAEANRLVLPIIADAIHATPPNESETPS